MLCRCRRPAPIRDRGAYALWVSLTFRLVNSSEMSQERAATAEPIKLLVLTVSGARRRVR